MGKKKERMSNRKAVFFDLDGTLLPMDNEVFFKLYYKQMLKSGVADVLHQERGIEMFFSSFEYMIKEHGQSSNLEAFTMRLEALSGVKREVFLPALEGFYRTHFGVLRHAVKNVPAIHDTLRVLKEKDYTLVLATSPVFPRIATEMRMEWAGLEKSDFAYVTYGENSRYAKPNLKYYEELLQATGYRADECYMVGNSVTEDLCALELGFEVFFVTDFHVGDIADAPDCPRGTYEDLLRWAIGLPSRRKEAV
jgi:FMN phosphatase YigB (HAD superfamily)